MKSQWSTSFASWLSQWSCWWRHPSTFSTLVGYSSGPHSFNWKHFRAKRATVGLNTKKTKNGGTRLGVKSRRSMYWMKNPWVSSRRSVWTGSHENTRKTVRRSGRIQMATQKTIRATSNRSLSSMMEAILTRRMIYGSTSTQWTLVKQIRRYTKNGPRCIRISYGSIPLPVGKVNLSAISTAWL